ncbi:RIP metalloprotease RseP [Paenibacillus sp. Soil522]|uniref:RIP metalloprotease RseP n=1 Tax=Paenibacillus sp. Soil522 TaxID=1736388 RepID=UPI0006FADBC2|nr:RIP metalloprotease RseP [Paenibacillus sp. Soil522]KRE39876.1 RIP metalloprotease RseP [Paenibacillus sp. Soil522]
MHMIQVVFLTVLVFFVIVSIHEWGHYYFAKRAGILVREFAIGFGPKLFSVKRGETRYTLRLIPAGGFVRMAGEDPEIIDVQPGQTIAVRVKDNRITRLYLDRLDERSGVIRGEVVAIDLERKLAVTLDVEGENESFAVHPAALMITKGKETQIAPLDRQFGSKTVAQRALAIFAGPMMNFILAFVLFAAYIQMAGIPVGTPDKLLVGEITEGMPASKVDLKEGDVIDAINGVKIGTDYDKMIAIIGQSPNVPVRMDIIRDGKAQQVIITPEPNEEGVGKVGIRSTLPEMPKRPATFKETFTGAGKLMKTMTISIFEGFKKLIFGEFKLDDLGGPVRTAEVTSQIAQQGITQLTSWTALLSLYLGIFNLLPIPALDGSRLIFLGIEAIRRRPIDPNRESMVHFVGFALIMLLMLVVTYNDILRLVRGE